jgi:hypothetical protein
MLIIAAIIKDKVYKIFMALKYIFNPMHAANSQVRKLKPEIIVLHDTNVSFEKAMQCLRQPISTGYHYIISNDGVAHCLCSIDRFIYAANPSNYPGIKKIDPVAIHIALEINLKPGYTKKQYKTLSDLLAALNLPYVLHKDIHTGKELREDPKDFDSKQLVNSKNKDIGIALSPAMAAILYMFTGTYNINYLKNSYISPHLKLVKQYIDTYKI